MNRKTFTGYFNPAGNSLMRAETGIWRRKNTPQDKTDYWIYLVLQKLSFIRSLSWKMRQFPSSPSAQA